MTYPISSQKQNIPYYSGITINITNPTLNPPSMYPQQQVTNGNMTKPCNCPANYYCPHIQGGVNGVNSDGNNGGNNNVNDGTDNKVWLNSDNNKEEVGTSNEIKIDKEYNEIDINKTNQEKNSEILNNKTDNVSTNELNNIQNSSVQDNLAVTSAVENKNSERSSAQSVTENRVQEKTSEQVNQQETKELVNNSKTETKKIEEIKFVNDSATQKENNNINQDNNIAQAQSYPPQYYLNNYNYIQGDRQNNNPANGENTKAALTQKYNPEPSNNVEEDMSSSKEIINEIDTKLTEQAELEKNSKKTRIIALTNEYIMSLENYLNNPNSSIRIMAAKEILTRLDEDKTRYDDAALNALLNKMLQDPDKIVRIAALSAFSSQLASGNDYTVQLLNNIQSNPNSDQEDIMEAADILLKMSASTEIKYTPQQTYTQEQQVN